MFTEGLSQKNTQEFWTIPKQKERMCCPHVCIDVIVSKALNIIDSHLILRRCMFYSSVFKLHIIHSTVYCRWRWTALWADDLITCWSTARSGVVSSLLDSRHGNKRWRELNQHPMFFFMIEKFFIHSCLRSASDAFFLSFFFLFPGLITTLSDVVMCCK